MRGRATVGEAELDGAQAQVELADEERSRTEPEESETGTGLRPIPLWKTAHEQPHLAQDRARGAPTKSSAVSSAAASTAPTKTSAAVEALRLANPVPEPAARRRRSRQSLYAHLRLQLGGVQSRFVRLGLGERPSELVPGGEEPQSREHERFLIGQRKACERLEHRMISCGDERGRRTRREPMRQGLLAPGGAALVRESPACDAVEPREGLAWDRIATTPGEHAALIRAVERLEVVGRYRRTYVWFGAARFTLARCRLRRRS
jgi:hypothetical protein